MARIKKMEVYPVAGKDCMELNLSGAQKHWKNAFPSLKEQE